MMKNENDDNGDLECQAKRCSNKVQIAHEISRNLKWY